MLYSAPMESREEGRAEVRPFRCIDRRVLTVTVTAMIVMVLLAWVARRQPLGSPPRILAAIAEGAAFAWMMLETVRSVRRLDELERRIHVEALASAAMIALVVIAAAGFLAKAGLPSIDWSWAAIALLAIVWVFEVLRITRRYR